MPAFPLQQPSTEPVQVGGENRPSDRAFKPVCSPGPDPVQPRVLQMVDGRFHGWMLLTSTVNCPNALILKDKHFQLAQVYQWFKKALAYQRVARHKNGVRHYKVPVKPDFVRFRRSSCVCRRQANRSPGRPGWPAVWAPLRWLFAHAGSARPHTGTLQ